MLKSSMSKEKINARIFLGRTKIRLHAGVLCDNYKQ